ncbi:MAG: aminopeptidase P family protein [Clostridiales bacterium]|uniref:aminopeptidase P family protein n=1 Tax=Clostridium sp. N3C TaxID=1776758 RepID=UPI00092E0079|nr:aminopeptidase P family protein [Clostridium sp. N3C]NLZ47503.1 aminopeptidase P family protein [Clostridiales bacterium]SCN23033.1 Xaa-Pro aminopeptidase [Clostridium sp. N3C]
MDKELFIANRKKFYDRLSDDSICILFSGNPPKKSADEMYAFSVNRNFFYITGIDEKDLVVVLSKINGNIETIIFIHKADPVMEKWVGKTISEQEAKERSGIDKVSYKEDFHSYIHKTLISGNIKDIYLDLERSSYEEEKTVAEKLADELKEKYPYLFIKNAYPILSELRMIKSKDEIDEIRKAIAITGEGILNAMRNAKVGMREYEVEAYFDFVLKTNGVKDFAFKTIAASGKNATVLHYSDNNDLIGENEMILMDLGAAVNYYNADITRTFPVSGKFTDRQKQIYNIVLKAQQETIKAIAPGVPFKELNLVTRRVFLEELSKLGLAHTDEELSKYYYHNVSHHLGLDTHDVGSREVVLKPGMVLTVEPGLYIEEESIGIRIEDDVVVTENGCEVLSSSIIKTIEEIEEYISNNGGTL